MIEANFTTCKASLCTIFSSGLDHFKYVKYLFFRIEGEDGERETGNSGQAGSREEGAQRQVGNYWEQIVISCTFVRAYELKCMDLGT